MVIETFIAVNIAVLVIITLVIEGSEDTHLHAVLSVSISRAEQVRLACFLRKKLRYVHRRVITSYCGEMTGLMSGCGENFGTSTNI
jgi:hypothetical protein